MMNGLVVQNPFAGSCIERQQRVGKKVGANSIAAVEIRCRRTRRDVDHPPAHIDSHPGPRIGTTGSLPGIWWPRVVPELSGSRNRMKRPSDLPGMHVVRTNISRL